MSAHRLCPSFQDGNERNQTQLFSADYEGQKIGACVIIPIYILL